jgi:hypothetical protein
MMHRLQFSVHINAEKSVIWNALWDDNLYRDWVGVFFEGSYAVTDDWKEGSTIQFLAPDQSGIYSTIEKHIPNTIMHFTHIGNVVEGKNLPVDDETKKWSGTTEIYTLTEKNDGNLLTVDIDIMDTHLEFMKATFPKALEIVKRNSEECIYLH